MKRLLFILLSALSLFSYAQTAADVSKSINNVKRDTMYIYAESTNKDLNEAYSNAGTLLEMQVGDWLRRRNPTENIEVCIVKAKEHVQQLDTRRGALYRAFMYVKKSDIMPVVNKNEVKVLEVSPAKSIDQPQSPHAIIVEGASSEEEKTPVLELTSEETLMKQVHSFYEIEPFINGLKSKGRIQSYGKYSTMPEQGNCHLFVYDKQGNIVALIRKTTSTQYNLNSLKEDNVKNYKNCGAIWFQLK